MDNKVTVYPLNHDDETVKKKTVATHTNFVSCCLFPNSDQQVCVYRVKYIYALLIYLCFIFTNVIYEINNKYPEHKYYTIDEG